MHQGLLIATAAPLLLPWPMVKPKSSFKNQREGVWLATVQGAEKIQSCLALASVPAPSNPNRVLGRAALATVGRHLCALSRVKRAGTFLFLLLWVLVFNYDESGLFYL